MVIIVKTRVELWKQIWSWPVVAVVVSLLIGGGLTFMTSNHPWLADVFYVAAGILFLAKFLTWEDARQLDRPKRNRSYGLAIGLTLAALCIAIWGDHRLSAPEVVQSPPVKYTPETTAENTPKAGAKRNANSAISPRTCSRQGETAAGKSFRQGPRKCCRE
jgi:hypothetical protein